MTLQSLHLGLEDPPSLVLPACSAGPLLKAVQGEHRERPCLQPSDPHPESRTEASRTGTASGLAREWKTHLLPAPASSALVPWPTTVVMRLPESPSTWAQEKKGKFCLGTEKCHVCVWGFQMVEET